MHKPYVAHEVLYQKMKAEGIRCWEQLNNAETYKRNGQIEQNAMRFLADALAQKWAPKEGRAIELGCGTGPMLRWLQKQGFTGLGVDVSKTAIAMAREQSKGGSLRFRRADICGDPIGRPGSFHLALDAGQSHVRQKDRTSESVRTTSALAGVGWHGPALLQGHGFPEHAIALALDGHCLHCITQPADRKRLLDNVHHLLREDGVFLVMAMCQPIDRGAFAKMYAVSPIIGSTVYAPFSQAADYLHARMVKGKLHMPTRHIGPWRSILKELREAGFRPKLVRLNECTAEDPVSSLCVAAVK